MNSPRARFLDTVSGSGRSSFFWDCIGYMGVTVEHWHSEGLPAEVEACGFLGQFGKPPYDYFGLDWVNFAPISHHYCPWFETVVVADEGETEVIMDECGVVLRRSKKSLSMPQYIEYPVRDEKTYEDLLFRRNAASPERWDSVKWEKWRRETGGSQSPIAAFIVGFFAIVRELMGVEEGLVAFYTNPGLVHRILRDHCDFCIELIRRALQETHLDFCFLWEDMSYKNGMLISPALFEEFIAPEATRFTDALRYLGLRDIIVDSDGDITELIPLYMRCGVNGFQPFEVQAGMNILEVRDKYPDLLIVGGIDKLAVARGGNVLENEILNKVGPMIDRGRYIPSLDHQAHPEMSLSNYLHYVKLVKSLLAQAGSRVLRDLSDEGIGIR